MTDDAYEHLADQLNALPNGFPRLPSGVEVQMLRKIFTPAQAAVVSTLSRELQTPAQVAARLGRPESQVAGELKELARAELIWPSRTASGLGFRLAPFVVGVFEAHLWQMDRESAELFERYMAEGGAKALMEMQPALERVVPAQGAADPEWIMPYDDVKALVERARGFSLRDCICRHERSLIGTACDAPRHNCLTLSDVARPPFANRISKEEALTVLDQAEEEGLVHTVLNAVDSVHYVCNCCGCCCALLRSFNLPGVGKGVARANYYAEIDQAGCNSCGICEDRCQVHAIRADAEVYSVDRSRCIGCGLCVTGCPDHAAHLHPLPAAEIIHPPADFLAWEEARLAWRGLKP